jgi:hypothetical protein
VAKGVGRGVMVVRGGDATGQRTRRGSRGPDRGSWTVTVPSEPESARGYTAEIILYVLVHRPACSRIFFHAWFSFIRVGEGG